MNYLLKLNFRDVAENAANPTNAIIKKIASEEEIDLTNEKTLRRLTRLRNDKVKTIFENGNYNFDVFQYALKDYFKRKDEKQKQEEEEAKKNQPHVPEKPSRVKRIVSSVFGCEFIMQIILVAAVFGLFLFFSNKDSAFVKMLWDSKK